MKSISITILFFVVLPLTGNAQVPDSLKYRSLKPREFDLMYLKTPNSLLIDVREFFEFRKKRLKGAINIPSSGNLENASDTLNKDCALFLYCSSGFRSKRAALLLSNKGFKKLYNLEGGIVAWKEEGMPVAKGRPARDSRHRAKKKT